MNSMLTGLLLLGFLATEVIVVAASDHVAETLVLPSLGDAVMSGPPILHPEEADYSGLSESELLRLAAGQDTK